MDHPLDRASPNNMHEGANRNALALQEDERQRVKRKRASKACDACRVRKVKCDTSRIPCPQCLGHEIPCLFTAPAKKRGPPNAYVEAQRLRSSRQVEIEQPYQLGLSRFHPVENAHQGQLPGDLPDEQRSDLALRSPPIFQTHAPGFSMGIDPNPRQDRGLEELAPPQILNMMFDDFFNLVFPICPIILETQFRRRLSDPAQHTGLFLALCGGVLGLTVACLRSNAPKYGGLTYERIYQFATERLGCRYRDHISVDVAATLEYLSLGEAYSSQVQIRANTRSAMLRAEFSCAVQSMIKGRLRDADFIERELLKRMFVYMYYVQISLELQGLEPHTPASQLVQLAKSITEEMTPLDLSDMEMERINVSNNGNNSGAAHFSALLVPSAKSYVAGLNFLSGLYRTYSESSIYRQDVNLSDGERLTRLFETLHKIGRFLDNVPVQLRWEENNKVHGIGFEVQKALLYVSRMHLSSTLLEQCYAIKSVHSQRSIRMELGRECRVVISETLRIIKTITRRALEANGVSLIVRTRQVASMLVDIIENQEDEEDEDAPKARQELEEFSEILGDLESCPPPMGQATISAGPAQNSAQRRHQGE